MQRISQVVARQRAHLGALVERVAHLDGAHVFDKSLLELAPHFLDDDKTLGRNATLAGIHHAALGADIGRDLDIRILENDVGVTPAKAHVAISRRDRPEGTINGRDPLHDHRPTPVTPVRRAPEMRVSLSSSKAFQTEEIWKLSTGQP